MNRIQFPSNRYGIRRYSRHLNSRLAHRAGNLGDGRLDVGRQRRERRHPRHSRRARPRNQPDRHRAGLRLRAVGGDRRQGAGRGRPAQERVHRHQGWTRLGDGKPFRNASKARIVEEAEQSLRRLRTDVIDLYQVHWPDPNTPIAEVADAMGELHRAGKIRAIGVSNFSPAQMDEFRKVAPLHAAQPPYNLFERSIDRMCCPIAAITTSPCSPMARCAAAFFRQHVRRAVYGRRSAQTTRNFAAALRAVSRSGRETRPVRARALTAGGHPFAARWVSTAANANIALGARGGPISSRRSRGRRLAHRRAPRWRNRSEFFGDDQIRSVRSSWLRRSLAA